MEKALDTLAVQAPIIVVMCGVVAALFWQLQKINSGTIDDLRRRLDGQETNRVSALAEIKDALKELGYKLDQKLDRIFERLSERRGGD